MEKKEEDLESMQNDMIEQFSQIAKQEVTLD